MIEGSSVSFQPSIMDALRSLGLSADQVKRNNRRALVSMGSWMVREMQEATTDVGQGQPGGPMWNDLSDVWLARKAEEGRSQLIGLYKGHMRRSVSFDVREDEVEAGPTVNHAAYFDKDRKITPEENYAAKMFALIILEAWA